MTNTQATMHAITGADGTVSTGWVGLWPGGAGGHLGDQIDAQIGDQLGGRIGDLVGGLWHEVAALWWPWLPVGVLALVAATVVVRVLERAAWRRVSAEAYWVVITPPRAVDPARWGLVWRRLAGLARQAGAGALLARPGVVFEIYGDRRGVRVGVWLPGRVRPQVAAAELRQVWPGCTVQVASPPMLGWPGGVMAGFWLAGDRWHPETGWLVDDPRPRPASGGQHAGGADPGLGMVFSALARAEAPVLVQVVVRPAPRGRLARLAGAGRRPPPTGGIGSRRASGTGPWLLTGLEWLVVGLLRVVLGVVEFFLTPTSAGSGSRSRTGRLDLGVDAATREAMAEARAKLADRPHLLVSVRVAAAAPRPSGRSGTWTRRDARRRVWVIARSAADGFSEASRWLEPVRLPRPQTALRLRRVRSGEWLLVSANELGVLAHLPADPALYGFATTPLHRAAPTTTPRPAAERSGAQQPGWTGSGWTTPPPGRTSRDPRESQHRKPRVSAYAAAHRATEPGDTAEEDDIEKDDEEDDEDDEDDQRRRPQRSTTGRR